jgi:hypothetical protein
MTKTIQLNPNFLSSSSRNADKGTRKMRDKKEKPNTLVQPNKMRNELLKRIKDYQSNTERNNTERNNTERNNTERNTEKINTEKNNTEKINTEKINTEKINTDRIEDIQDFTDDFNKSLHFLQDLTNNKDKLLKNNKTKKNLKSYDVDIELPDEMNEDINSDNTIETPKIDIDFSIPEPAHTIPEQAPNIPEQAPIIPEQVPTIPEQTPIISTHDILEKPYLKTSTYSSIKNGSKPTYREIYKPIQPYKPKITIEDNKPIEESENHKMLEKIKSNYKNASSASTTSLDSASLRDTEYIPKRKIKRTIRTCKYRLGKLGNKISVLIKDYKTRKNIQNECYKLEKKSISDIKNFLRKKNLLKVGSVADEAVLREMYENCILAGDIENKNKDTLIHNFLAKV